MRRIERSHQIFPLPIELMRMLRDSKERA